MIRRVGAALLLLTVVACHARKEQGAPPATPATPATLYAEGREAVQREEFEAAAEIAAEGKKRFAAQPYWRELFGVLDAESALGLKDGVRALRLLDETPQTGAPLSAVRRLMVVASTLSAKEANAKLLEADALAARVQPQLRPEIATRRSLQLFVLQKTDEAIACARQAAKDAQAPWLRAIAYTYLAHIESNSVPRRFADAIKDYSAAIPNAQAARSKTAEARARANLGWCQIEMGFLDDALLNENRALSLATEQSNLEYQHIALSHIADIYIRRLEYDNALPYVQRNVELARQLKKPKDLANALHQLGQLELERGNYDLAAQWTSQALANRVDEPEGVLTERLSQARILAATGDPAAALEILRDILLASRNPKPDAPMRWRAQGITADIYAKLGQLDKAQEMYEQTLATGTKARDIVRGTDSSLAFDRNFLGFYDNYIQLLLDEERPADALKIAERSRARALREAVGLESNVDVDPVKLAREKNATILCYWIGPRRSLLWTVTPRGIAVDDTLPDDDAIARDADAYRAELLEARSAGATSALGRKLYTMLVAPAKVPPGSRVIIRPDSHLNALNFETLIVPEPKPHYWIEDVTISYSPSLVVLARTPARHGVRDARALLLGDVPAVDEYPRLVRAGAELADVAKHFDASCRLVLAGTKATPAAYAAAHPEQFEYIHFAAHATANSSEPLDSAIILARDGGNGPRLSGHKIVGTPLAAELVTLSSCDSAGGRSYAGEGLVGLAWAFLRAGAHRVIAAQWDVNDIVAPQIMDAMYDGIRDGMEPAAALRQAKLKLLRSRTIREQPYYWGPFVLYGE